MGKFKPGKILTMEDKQDELLGGFMTVTNCKTDPTEQLAQSLAKRVYIDLGCSSVPLLQRSIAKALREEKARQPRRVKCMQCETVSQKDTGVKCPACGGVAAEVTD